MSKEQTSRLAVGFLGAGEIAEATALGLVQSKFVTAEQLIAASPSGRSRGLELERSGIQVVTDNRFVARQSNLLFVCVKREVAHSVLDEVAASSDKTAMVVSLVGGLPLAELSCRFSGACAVAMPNIAVRICRGVTAYTAAAGVDTGLLAQLFSQLGLAVELAEDQFPAVVGTSASGIALLWKIAAALSASGQAAGLDREQAEAIVAQTMMGAGQMMLEIGKSSKELCSSVCTPGGVTEAGIGLLERKQFDTLIADAIEEMLRKLR